MKNIKYFNKQIKKNKIFEFQLYYSKIEIENYFSFSFNINDYNNIFYFNFLLLGDILNINFIINRKVDHAGIRLDIVLFGLSLELSYYDNRHWNDENEKFED